MEEQPRTDFGFLKDGRYVPVPGAASRNEVVKNLRDNAIGGLHHVVQSKGYFKIEVISSTTCEEVDADFDTPVEDEDDPRFPTEPAQE